MAQLIGIMFLSFAVSTVLANVTPSTSTLTSESIAIKAAEALSLQQHSAIRLAREEVAVADLKRREAKRALWPSLTAKAEQTDGDAVDPLGTPAFKERSYGLEASQTIYGGGKLHDTYRQAFAAWESVKAKEKKAESDVIYGVREAAWSFIKARAVREVYVRAFAELAKEKVMAQQLIARDAISREVHLQILSQYNQAQAALEGADAEVEARLWQWTAALGLDNPPSYRPDDRLPDAPASSLTLADCLHLAETNNPDLIIQRKTAEAAFYGSRAGQSLYKPSISVNGFYGRSGGAFNSEPLTLGEDWQAGIQLTQYFSMNTLNLSGFDQHTSPKIGQSTRTVSKTASASLGILDGYKKKSEAGDTTLAFHEADVQMHRTSMEVANGVREAFANWKKAAARVKMAENDFPLAKADFAIARIKSAHREVPFSERAIWRNRMAQAEAALAEAEANYQTSLAVLAHAVGSPDQFYH